MNDFETAPLGACKTPLTNSELERDIVNELMAFEAVHANEDADMAIRAAKEISRLRAALCSSSQRLSEQAHCETPDGRNEVSTKTEAQPEVKAKPYCYAIVAYGNIQKTTKREDVAFEEAEKASDNCIDGVVEVVPLYSVPSSAIEGYAQELAKDIASKLVNTVVREKLEAFVPCTPEEAAVIAINCNVTFDHTIDCWLIDNEDLANIINAYMDKVK